METVVITDHSGADSAGMIFEDKIGIKLCISGGIGALLLILTGVISEKDALKSIDLKTIFFLGVHFLLQQLCRKQEPVN